MSICGFLFTTTAIVAAGVAGVEYGKRHPGEAWVSIIDRLRDFLDDDDPPKPPPTATTGETVHGVA